MCYKSILPITLKKARFPGNRAFFSVTFFPLKRYYVQGEGLQSIL